MKLLINVNEKQYAIKNFQIAIDFKAIPTNRKGLPAGEMPILCSLEASQEDHPFDSIVLREILQIKTVHEQYQEMKKLVNFLKVFDYRVRREENLVCLTVNKKERFGVANIKATIDTHKGDIDAVAVTVEAGLEIPREDLGVKGFQVEFHKGLYAANLDAPPQVELAHTTTQLLSMFGFDIQTDIEMDECTKEQENTDTSTDKEK